MLHKVFSRCFSVRKLLITVFRRDLFYTSSKYVHVRSYELFRRRLAEYCQGDQIGPGAFNMRMCKPLQSPKISDFLSYEVLKMNSDIHILKIWSLWVEQCLVKNLVRVSPFNFYSILMQHRVFTTYLTVRHAQHVCNRHALTCPLTYIFLMSV